MKTRTIVISFLVLVLAVAFQNCGSNTSVSESTQDGFYTADEFLLSSAESELSEAEEEAENETTEIDPEKVEKLTERLNARLGMIEERLADEDISEDMAERLTTMKERILEVISILETDPSQLKEYREEQRAASREARRAKVCDRIQNALSSESVSEEHKERLQNHYENHCS